MCMYADGRTRPGTTSVRLYPCALKKTLRPGKDVYLDTGRLSASRPGVYKLVVLSAGNDLISKAGNGFRQGFQFR